MDSADDGRIVSVLDYCAGIFEGEGYAGVTRIRRHHDYAYLTPRIHVSMTDPEPVHLLHQTLGGYLTFSHSPSSKKLGRQPQFRWGVMTRQALRVALLLLPHCQSARKRAQLQTIVDHYRPDLVRQRRLDGATKAVATRTARARMTIES